MKYSIQIFLRDQINAAIPSTFSDLGQVKTEIDLVKKAIEEAKKKNKLVFLNDMYFNPEHVQFIRIVEVPEQVKKEEETIEVK